MIKSFYSQDISSFSNDIEYSNPSHKVKKNIENQLDIYRDHYLFHDFYTANLNLVRYELNNEGRKASVYTVIIIDHWFDQCEYENIDSLLFVMLTDINYLTKWSIVSLLRSTYSAKDLLHNWQIFYEKSYEILEQKDYDAKKLLRGLNR